MRHFFDYEERPSNPQRTTVNQSSERAALMELERIIQRQGLMIETLSRLLLAKGVVQEAELDQWMDYVDGLDGATDGRLRARKVPLTCPSCNRNNPPTLTKCMYCGKEFPAKFLTVPADGQGG